MTSLPAQGVAHGAVIYTDGSSKLGYYGMGAHGYTYIHLDDKEKPTRINAWVATDKGYYLEKDVGKDGGVPVKALSCFDISIPGQGLGTNNVAEILAMAAFFEELNYRDVLSKLHVIADSRYALQGITEWIHGWMRNGWIKSNGEAVNNQEHWERLYGHVQDFKQRGEITFGWVRGHNGELGNSVADLLAGLGTARHMDGHTTTILHEAPHKDYWRREVDLHPLISLKRIYFNTDPASASPGIYYQTGFSSQNHIEGKRTPDASFAVVSLAEPEPVVEAVLERQRTLPSDYNAIMFIKMDRLRSPDIYNYLKNYGGHCLTMDDRCRNLNSFSDKKPVTLEVRPGELPLASIETLNFLLSILERFVAEYPTTGTMEPGPLGFHLHEVTEHFYETGEKKVGKQVIPTKTLRKEFGVGCKSTAVSVTENVRGEDKLLELPLVFMDDIPARNTMKNLEGSDPKVFLITWRESAALLRYSTVIQTSDAVGVWSNYFANQLFL